MSVNQDREYVHSHTKWLQRAIEWDFKGKSTDLLLRGSELAVAEAWLKDTQCQKKQPAATELQKAYIAKSGGHKRKNRLVLIGAVVSVMGIVTTAAIASTALWLKAERQTKVATLRENAARVQNLLTVEPVEALILAIKATGESQSSPQEVREKTFPLVQSSLYNASGDARERNILQGHENWVSSVAFSPDGKIIVSGSNDGTIRLWDIKGNPIGQPFTGHEDRVMSVAFSPNGKTIVSGGDDGIRLWDTQGNPIGQPFTGHRNWVSSVAFSPDGKTIASGGGGGIRLWDTQGTPISQPFTGHQNSVSSVAFSPNGKTIVSDGGGGTIRLWDIKGNPISQPFIGHQNPVRSLVYTPNSITHIYGGGSPFTTSVAFSPDGKSIVSGGGDGTIRLWRSGNWLDWLNVACTRLIGHPILVTPETVFAEDSETLKVAKDAGKTCQNSVWNKTQNVQFLVNQGSAIAREGDIEGANAKFQDARKLASNINVPTSAQVRGWAAEGWVNKGEKLVKEGKVKEALAAYNQAQTIDPTWKNSAYSWNTLCRNGSLHGEAAKVMQACEKAVTLAPTNGEFRDSRGIARAMTGNKPGAIEDFQAFIKSTDSDEWKKQRQTWIDALKAGKNPFTPEVIEKLKR